MPKNKKRLCNRKRLMFAVSKNNVNDFEKKMLALKKTYDAKFIKRKE